VAAVQFSPLMEQIKPLFRMALANGIDAAVRLHLSRGSRHDARDDRGRTPLMIAAASGHRSVCEILLEAGADTMSRDNDGVAAFEIARRAGYAELADLLEESSQQSAAGEVGPDGSKSDDVPDQYDASEFDLSAWDSEEDSDLSGHDAGLIESGRAVQSAIDAFRPPAVETSWSDIQISLPQTAGQARSSRQIPPALRKLLRIGLAEGRLPRSALVVLANKPIQQKAMSIVLADAGVVVDSAAEELLVGSGVSTRGIQLAEPDRVSDAEELLASLLHPPASLRGRYLDALAAKRVTDRAGETSIFRALSAARRQLAVAISSAGNLSHLFAEHTPQSVTAESDTDNDDTSDPSDEDEALFEGPELLPDGSSEDWIRQPAGRLSEISEIIRTTELHTGPLFALREKIERYLDARKRAIEANLTLVPWVAQRYRRSQFSQADLIQEGNLGLIKAVERFDAGRGTRFSTYATWWIRQTIHRSISDKSRTIRMPVHFSDQVWRLARARRKIRPESGLPASPAEIETETGLSEARQRHLDKYSQDVVALDAGRNMRRLMRRADDQAVSPRRAAAEGRARAVISELLTTLAPREERVLRMRFGLGASDEMTLEDVGFEFGVTRERIRQVEGKALEKLAHPSRARIARRLLRRLNES